MTDQDDVQPQSSAAEETPSTPPPDASFGGGPLPAGDERPDRLASESADAPSQESAAEVTPTAPPQAPADALARAQLEASTSPVHQARFAPLPEGQEKGKGTNLDLLLDVSVTVTAEMGSRSLPLEQVLELKPGSVVELDRAADEPIDLLVNGKPIARGEVVVIEDQFGVRITEILEVDVGHARRQAAQA